MINVGCGSCGARSALSPSPAAPTTTGAPCSNLQNLTDTTRAAVTFCRQHPRAVGISPAPRVKQSFPRRRRRHIGRVRKTRPSGEAAISPEAAGTQRTDRRRETRAAAGRAARVTATRRAAGSRPKESRAAARGDAQGPRRRFTRGANQTSR